MIKFEKYEHSAFTGKKINKFGQKAKILQKNENAHEIRKKTTGLCPGVYEMDPCNCTNLKKWKHKIQFPDSCAT